MSYIRQLRKQHHITQAQLEAECHSNFGQSVGKRSQFPDIKTARN